MFAKLFPALLVGAMFAISAPLHAQNFNMMPMNGINLSAQQQKQIQDIRDKYGADNARQAMQTARPFSQEMQGFIAAKTFDEAGAREFLNRRAQVQVEMQLRMMQQQNEIYQVLTPKQRELWQQNRERRLSWGQQGRRGGMRGQNMPYNNNMQQPCFIQ